MKIIKDADYYNNNPTLYLGDPYLDLVKKCDSIDSLFDRGFFGYFTQLKSKYKDFSSGERKRIFNKYCKNINVSIDLLEYLLESGKFQELIEIAPNADIIVELNKMLEPTQEVNTIAMADQLLKEHNRKLYIGEYYKSLNILYELNDVLFANKQLDDWANEINSATVGGKNLSVLEKFIYAYMIVKDRYYKKEDDIRYKWLSRNIVSVLNTDYCVCVGFAGLLKELCSRIGIKCCDKSVKVGEYHAINAVIIDDAKYGIENALYYSDPTHDCLSVGDTFLHSLLPNIEEVYDSYFDIENEKCKELDKNEKNLFSDEKTFKQAQSNAKKISHTTMIKAITAVFESKGLTTKDASNYLKPTIDLVLHNQELYKKTWVYDLFVAHNKIKEQNTEV